MVSKPGRLRGVLVESLDGAEADDWTELTKESESAEEVGSKEMDVEA